MLPMGGYFGFGRGAPAAAATAAATSSSPTAAAAAAAAAAGGSGGGRTSPNSVATRTSVFSPSGGGPFSGAAAGLRYLNPARPDLDPSRPGITSRLEVKYPGSGALFTPTVGSPGGFVSGGRAGGVAGGATSGSQVGAGGGAGTVRPRLSVFLRGGGAASLQQQQFQQTFAPYSSTTASGRLGGAPGVGLARGMGPLGGPTPSRAFSPRTAGALGQQRRW